MEEMNMVDYAQTIHNRTDILDEIKLKYTQKEQGTKIVLVIFSLMGLFMATTVVGFGEDSRMALVATLLFFGFLAGFMILTMKNWKKRLQEVIDNNEPLLLYKGEVVRYYKVNGGKNKKDKCYIEFSNDITIRIPKSQYKDYKYRDVKNVDVFFYEKLLQDDVYIIKENM